MRLLITGAAGMLGQAVQETATGTGHDVLGLDRAEMDVTDASAVRSAVGAFAPTAIIHCAAWTDVDGAESDEDAATAVNGTGAGNVAAAAAATGALMVQLSTDYVFDGNGDGPYVESSPTGPLSAYGRSKLAGERAVAQGAPRSAIVRSAWIFGQGGRNFVDTMLRLGAERDEVTVVDDQVGCPTYTGHLAAALVEIAERGLTGTMHVAGGGSCTWHELAEAAFEATGTTCNVRRGRTADLGRAARRPLNSVLRSERDDVPVLPDWREGLAAYLAARKRVPA